MPAKSATPLRTENPNSARLAFDLPLDDEHYKYTKDDAPKSSPLPHFHKSRTTHRPFLSDDDASSDDAHAAPSKLLFESAISPRKGIADEEEDNHLNDVLAGVRFTELKECDVCSSDDEQPHPRQHRRILPPRELSPQLTKVHQEDNRHDGDDVDYDDDDSWFGGVHLTRTPHSPPAPHEHSLPKDQHPTTHAADPDTLPPSNSCSSACSMCSSLASENRRLRRLLDESDFRLAVAEAERSSHSRSDSSSSNSSWHSSLSRRARSSHLTISSSNSQKSRVHAELKALTVTTEYLWRKLTAAERELSDLRAAGIRAPPSPGWREDLEDQLLATRVDPTALLHRALSH